MAFTAHGYHILGTTLEGRPEKVARCGGPPICPQCKSTVKEFLDIKDIIQNSKPPRNVPDDFPAKAKRTLINYVDSQYSEDFEKPVFEVYVVRFVKVLQHWKALVCTDRPDSKYYELTYNGDKRETYVDEYVMIKNTVIPD